MNKPNIITILVDDMGYSDIGCYGGEVETPVLDDLAGGGVQFTDFYNTPRCCPSRASLLTGLTPHKAGVGWMSFDWSGLDADADGYVGTLNRNCLTISEALKDAGYRSYHSGKWHVTSDMADRDTWPTGRGFDRSFCLLAGMTDYFHPDLLTLDEKFYQAPKETYFTDLIGTYSARFVDRHYQDHPEDPFFMYVAYTAPHFPMQAPEPAIARYRETYAAGWDVLRERRYRRMQELGVIRPEWELPPRPETIPAWDSLDAAEQAKQAEQMATYAAMIQIMDTNVGRLVEALKRNNALENTLILFLSDNGACAEGPTMGSETHYGECWAHLSNTPFRLYKHFTCQGGVQTPFIAHWPDGIPEDRKGSFEDWTGTLYDIMPTALELAGASYPSEHDGRSLHPLDGTSMAPVLRGDGGWSRPDIFIEHEGNQMVRSGPHKLVRQHTDPAWQLYDMEKDRSEMNDVAPEMPERFVELAQAYSHWESKAHVIPWERGQRYMSYTGFQTHRTRFYKGYRDAMEEAGPEGVINGDEIGD
jgi:arylsulfatase